VREGPQREALPRLTLDFDGSVQSTKVHSENRVVGFKKMIGGQKRWCKIDETWSYFEATWNPKFWKTRYRIIFIRKKTKLRRKGMFHQHLFEPWDFGFNKIL